MRAKHASMILVPLLWDRRQTLVIHTHLRCWPESGRATAPCWCPKRISIFVPTRGNSCCFAPGRPLTKHKSCDFTLAPHRENPLHYCVLVQKMMVLSGHEMVTETSPGTANTAQHCKCTMFLCVRTKHAGMILATLLCDRRQTLVIHVLSRRWPESGRAAGPCWCPQRTSIFVPTRGNSCCFAPGRPTTKHKNCNFTLAPLRENPLCYGVLVQK